MQAIDGAKVTSSLGELQRLAERYLAPFGVEVDLCPHTGQPRFCQTVREPHEVCGLSVLVKEKQHISYVHEGVRIWDVLTLRADYRKTKERIEEKLRKATSEQREAEARLEDLKQNEVRPFLEWCARNRNEGRFSVLVQR